MKGLVDRLHISIHVFQSQASQHSMFEISNYQHAESVAEKKPGNLNQLSTLCSD